jgi:stage V sporulation protein G
MPERGIHLTEIRTKLVSSRRDKLRAFATITLADRLVIRDLKIIDGPRGLFVAMPSRRLQDRCPRCSCKNHVRARYCNDCGGRLRPDRVERDPSGRERLYADIAHPIDQGGRAQIQRRVLAAYESELERSRDHDYVAATFEGLDYDDLAATAS